MRIRPALFAIPFLSVALQAAIAAGPIPVAFLGTAESGGDPRFSYLEPLISGLFLYDLSSAEGLALTDRGMLEDVLREQELSLNLGKGDAAKLGGILGARWVLKAEYAVMGQEVSVSLTMVDVETAQAFVFTDRGADENLVHGIAEKAFKKLCGIDASFRSEQHKRSLLSLKDVKPGSISLHCALIDAEIFLDGAFAAYSLGNVRVPIKFDNVEPGPHTLSVRLGGFGMVKLPEIAFKDWEQTVEVLPGKNIVVKAEIRLFSDLYYDLAKLVREDFRLLPEPGKNAKEFRKDIPFADRQGKNRPIALSFKASRDAKGGSIAGELSIDGKTLPFELSCPAGKDAETSVSLGPLKLSAKIGLAASSRDDYSVKLERTDIEFGEWPR